VASLDPVDVVTAAVAGIAVKTKLSRLDRIIVDPILKRFMMLS
jgi:hypothetical protein